MEIQFYGANCIRLTTKKASIVVDDNLSELGLKSVVKPSDIVLYTSDQKGRSGLPNSVVIDSPGEYEVSDTSMQGVAARAHMDEEKQKSATMFKVIGDDIRVVVTGHVYPELSDEQLEALGTVDVLIIPVGGNGYTLDGIGALKLIKKIEPKIIIPTHFADGNVKYPVPQQPLEEALKGLAMEPKETVPKLKVKPGEMGDTAQLIILERQ